MPRARDPESDAGRSSVLSLVRLLVAPIVWALHLGIVYGGHAVLCAVWGRQGVPQAGGVYWLVGMATVAALATIAASTIVLPAPHRGRVPGATAGTEQFRYRVAVLLAILSAMAIAWTGTAAAIVPACAAS